jgi:chaperonin GroES
MDEPTNPEDSPAIELGIPAEAYSRMMIQPIRDRIIVRRKAAPTTMKAGDLELVVPDQYKAMQNEGTVLAIGDGRILQSGVVVPLALKVGDRVIFGRFSGTDVELNGERLLMLREDDVVAAIRPDDGSGNMSFTDETLEPAKTPEQEIEEPEDTPEEQALDDKLVEQGNAIVQDMIKNGPPPEGETREEFRARMRRLAEEGDKE